MYNFGSLPYDTLTQEHSRGMSYHPNVYMEGFSRYQSCRILAVSAMEMVFKCGRAEIEYKAALGLRQSLSSLY